MSAAHVQAALRAARIRIRCTAEPARLLPMSEQLSRVAARAVWVAGVRGGR